MKADDVRHLCLCPVCGKLGDERAMVRVGPMECLAHDFAKVSISSVTTSIRSSSCRQSLARSATMRPMRGDRTSVRLARMSGSAWRRYRSPCRTMMPRSRRKPRIRLITAVRSLTRRDRTRCRACRSSCSSVLAGTKRVVGRCTASATAWASRKSFVPLPKRLRIRGRDLLHIVAKHGKLASNVVRRHFRFDANETGWQVRKPRRNASA